MNRIRELRKQKGVSQKELSIELSLSQPTVCAWEKGVKEPSNKSASKLADYFGVSMDYLLGRSDNISPQKEQPIIDKDDELRMRIINRVKVLSDPALIRTWDYLEGLQAGQEIFPAKPADHDPNSAPPE